MKALRGFARDRARSHGDPGSDNLVVHGDNLQAMRRLAGAGFCGRFRCVYIDPPFNSGRRFAEYEDALPPAEWLDMMRARLVAARELVSDDGAVFVEIDDTELGQLLAVMDEVYGRAQRVSTITVVRSAATGHKASNRGPVNVTDYLLVYAKDRRRWRCNQLTRPRPRYDAAYGTWLENPGKPARGGGSCRSRRTLGRRWGSARAGRTSSGSPWSTPSTSCASPSRATRP